MSERRKCGLGERIRRKETPSRRKRRWKRKRKCFA